MLLCYINILLRITNFIFHFIFFPIFFIIVLSFNYLLLLCIGLYSPFQLCKIKILYCKWIERGYKYIFYVKSSNCTILNVSAVIYVIMFMYNLEINYLSICGGQPAIRSEIKARWWVLAPIPTPAVRRLNTSVLLLGLRRYPYYERVRPRTLPDQSPATRVRLPNCRGI